MYRHWTYLSFNGARMPISLHRAYWRGWPISRTQTDLAFIYLSALNGACTNDEVINKGAYYVATSVKAGPVKRRRCRAVLLRYNIINPLFHYPRRSTRSSLCRGIRYHELEFRGNAGTDGELRCEIISSERTFLRVRADVWRGNSNRSIDLVIISYDTMSDRINKSIMRCF